jgi:hypothetical protein
MLIPLLCERAALHIFPIRSANKHEPSTATTYLTQRRKQPGRPNLWRSAAAPAPPPALSFEPVDGERLYHPTRYVLSALLLLAWAPVQLFPATDPVTSLPYPRVPGGIRFGLVLRLRVELGHTESLPYLKRALRRGQQL